MMASRIYRFISARLLSSLLLLTLVPALTATAQKLPSSEEEKPIPLINGIAVGANLFGLGQQFLGSDWMQLEAMARLNLKDKYFPIIEMGIGQADHEGKDLDNHFTTRAPFFRIGCDYNFTKKHNGNRLFTGLRYGFSYFTYDIDAASPLADPIWGTQQEVNFTNLSGNQHWAEVIFGLETRLWSIIRLGWDVRIKFRIVENSSTLGSAWYVPGFGINDTSCWGGSFKLLFDI